MTKESEATLTYDSYKQKKATFEFMTNQQKRPLGYEEKMGVSGGKKPMTDKR